MEFEYLIIGHTDSKGSIKYNYELSIKRANTVKELLSDLQEYSQSPLVIRQIPIRENGKIIGATDVIHERAYTYEKNKPS